MGLFLLCADVFDESRCLHLKDFFETLPLKNNRDYERAAYFLDAILEDTSISYDNRVFLASALVRAAIRHEGSKSFFLYDRLIEQLFKHNESPSAYDAGRLFSITIEDPDTSAADHQILQEKIKAAWIRCANSNRRDLQLLAVQFSVESWKEDSFDSLFRLALSKDTEIQERAWDGFKLERFHLSPEQLKKLRDAASKIWNTKSKRVNLTIGILPHLSGAEKEEAKIWLSYQMNGLAIDAVLSDLPIDNEARRRVLIRTLQNAVKIHRGSLTYRVSRRFSDELEARKIITSDSIMDLSYRFHIRDTEYMAHIFLYWIQQAREVLPPGDPIFFQPFDDIDKYRDFLVLALEYPDLFGDQKFQILSKMFIPSDLGLRFSVVNGLRNEKNIPKDLLTVIFSDSTVEVPYSFIIEYLGSYQWTENDEEALSILKMFLNHPDPVIPRAVFQTLIASGLARGEEQRKIIEDIMIEHWESVDWQAKLNFIDLPIEKFPRIVERLKNDPDPTVKEAFKKN